ncbi:MAG: hypothetical protein AB8H80_05965 [Planctomycetota bacterium]
MATAAFVVAIVFMLLVEVAGVRHRFARPEQNLRRAMKRIRAGDVGFRIPDRGSEPLGRLVSECNSLLEWLNHNPPDGARVDDDMFELPEDVAEDEA